ncbi:MAG TPA: NADH-quinone oxidoreductase subunit J [Verrucomicrobiae bacterium]|jgi:NADH-quinone oxidoreductase subunit J|nr:NADH-quinone oxidoreductase subunit J [Verrucomicrobiae bacterium]
MHPLIFYIFAALTLLCGALVVANPFSRNPVTSAMFLILTIIFMACLFVLLHAFFLSAVQVLVYAGAVMVLFVFVVMLLDLPAEERRKIKLMMAGLGILSTGVIAYAMIRAVRESTLRDTLAPPTIEGSMSAVGSLLFTRFALPFELLSLLLLAAMIGVILLSKKDLK